MYLENAGTRALCGHCFGGTSDPALGWNDAPLGQCTVFSGEGVSNENYIKYGTVKAEGTTRGTAIGAGPSAAASRTRTVAAAKADPKWAAAAGTASQ